VSTLRRTLRTAVVVGLVLTVINQLDVILSGDTSALVWVKVALNFCVPSWSRTSVSSPETGL